MLELITDWSLETRCIIAFVISFGGVVALGNKMILKLISMKLGQPVRSKEEVNELFDLHGSKAGTPTMGGVLIIGMILVGVLLVADLTNPYVHVATFVLLGLGVLGFKDDYAKIAQGNSKGVSSKFKLVWQVGVAAIASVWLYYVPEVYEKTLVKGDGLEGVVAQVSQMKYASSSLIHIPFVSQPIDIGIFVIPFFMLMIVGASNAVNLTDGLDGLASGCTITTGLSYALLSFGGAQYLGMAENAVFALAMVGAVLGFLWFNAYPARVFMGDTGSLALGGALAVVAIAAKQEILLVIIGSVFVIEAMSVMIQMSYYKYTKKKFGEGKRILKCAPIHHHFELTGWKETQVITRFWIISFISAIIGVWLGFK